MLSSAGFATILAVDIGGTKIAVGLLDRAGRLRWSRQAPTPANGAEAIFDALAALVRAAPPGSLACGVGCGGPMTAGGPLIGAGAVGWRGYDG